VGYLGLLRRRRILTLWAAQMLSVLGDRLYARAVMWIAWEQFGAAAMGLVAIAESVPYVVLGTFGRVVLDRFASLRGLSQLDLVRAGLVVLLPWTWTAFGLPGLLVSAALLGVCGALFDPDLGALVPDLVERDQVQAVNGLMDLTGRIARVAGPGSAGLLLAVMPMAAVFWLDGVTFAVSAVALHLLARRAARVEKVPLTSGPAPPDRREAVPKGWALLRTHPVTATLLGVHACGIFAGAVSMAMPALLTTRLDAGAGTYGTVLAVVGAGALLGNAVVGNLRLPRRLPILYCAAWVVSGALLAVTGVAASLPMLLVISAASGATSPFLAVALATHLAQYAPPARRRLLTIDQTLIRSAGTVSMLVLPAMAAADPRTGFLIGGLATIAAGGLGCAVVTWRAHRPVTSRAADSAAEAAELSPVLSGTSRG
jgi:hypothetical protein